jgi:hypothetical protein
MVTSQVCNGFYRNMIKFLPACLNRVIIDDKNAFDKNAFDKNLWIFLNSILN